MKKITYRLLLLTIAIAVICSGCSAKSSSPQAVSMDASATQDAYSDGGMQASPEIAQEISQIVVAESDVTPNPLKDRKIIKHSNLSLETKEFDAAIPQITNLVTSVGGYIAEQSIDGYSLNHRDAYYERSTSIHARVPADRLAEVTASVGTVCNIVSQSESMEDISDVYFDSKAHLDTLKIQEERLLEILKKAEKLEDVITLEKALSDVRYEIESLTASVKRMDSQVAYSYLNIGLREVVEYNTVATAPKTFGDKLIASLGRSGNYLVSSLEGFTLFAVETLPVMLLWAAIIACVTVIALKLLRRLGAHRDAKIAKQIPPAKDAGSN